MARTLLIVDDHPGFRAFARALLAQEGFDIVGEAADGASAILAAQRLHPEVVLVDIALPDLDGFQVCERVTQVGPARPTVILTSSRDVTMYRDRLAASRARAFIAKDRLTGAALLTLTG